MLIFAFVLGAEGREFESFGLYTLKPYFLLIIWHQKEFSGVFCFPKDTLKSPKCTGNKLVNFIGFFVDFDIKNLTRLVNCCIILFSFD